MLRRVSYLNDQFTELSHPGQVNVNRDSGVESATPGWLQRLERRVSAVHKTKVSGETAPTSEVSERRRQRPWSIKGALESLPDIERKRGAAVRLHRLWANLLSMAHPQDPAVVFGNLGLGNTTDRSCRQ